MPNVTLYKSTANPRRLDKTNFLTQLSTATMSFNEDFDVEEPYIILKYSPGFLNCNYISVDGFGYYFVDDPILEIGDRLKFNMTKDVLMSNLAEILELDVITDRASKDYNSYIYDGRQKAQVNKKIFSIPLGGFSIGGSVILSTIASIGTGGVDSEH